MQHIANISQLEFFNEVILRAVTDSYVRYRNGPFHYWLDKWICAPKDRNWIILVTYRRVAPPIMSRFIEAEMKSDVVQLPLSALKEVVQVLNEIEPIPEPEQQKLRARRIYEAAASYLDWDSDHKFASSWLGDIPRRESPGVDEKKQTLLGAAVVVGILSTIQKLLEDASIDVNHESPFFGGPLQLAARRGDAAILCLLLSHGAKPRTMQVQSDRTGPAIRWRGRAWWAYWSTHGSALRVASLAGHLGIVHILLGPQHALPLEDCRSALLAAAQGGHVQVIQAILKAHPDLDTVEVKALVFFRACKYGRIEVVKMMISSGVSPHHRVRIDSIHGINDFNGLQFAAWRGHISIVRLLLDYILLHYSVDDLLPISNNLRPLFDEVKPSMDLALRGGHLDCVETLFNLGCFPERYWSGGIRWALPHVPLFRLLVRLGVPLNIPWCQEGMLNGQRVLLDAIEYGREAVVRVLLELGVSPNSANQKTHPTLLAKVYGFDHVLKILLEFGGENIDLGESVFKDEFREGKIPHNKNRGKSDPWAKEWWGRDF